MILSENNIREILVNIPHQAGVYQYFDNKGKIIYIGKAKNLKKRVSSYFNKKTHEHPKVNLLVKQIAEIKTIIVDSEQDALLLENNLIKKYQPKYNVMLKDDKTFPWICIKNEDFPRVVKTRNFIQDGSEYFGPYTNVKMVNTLIDLIKSLYPLRNCNHNLNPENITQKKYRLCLEYHVKNCLGPCQGLQDSNDYNQNISLIKSILKGNINIVINHLEKLMSQFAKELLFEKAHIIKEKLKLLENFRTKSTIVNPNIHNVDVFSILSDEKYAYVNFLKVINGAIIQAHTVEILKKLNESNEELLEYAIISIRERFNSNTEEILVPIKLNLNINNVKFIIPKIGDKKKLIELSERNVFYYKMERDKQKLKQNTDKKTERILLQLQKDLKLSDLPIHIECFDNSNTQGNDPVAACVVFKNAKPANSEYRHFNIKTVQGPNDFDSMTEVVYRRYKRLLEENQDLPQLIVIDGGKGQLSSAVKSLKKLNIYGKMAIIGIAKKLEEIYFPEDSIPLYIDKRSESLKVLQNIRNEAHRFGITHHRNKRSKTFIKSELDQIKGIGESTKKTLLENYGSVDQIKNKNESELSNLIGKSKAKIIYLYFNKT